jgi:hypothetical protein
MVATFEFYSGGYTNAAFNYEEALFYRHKFVQDRENPMLCIMVLKLQSYLLRFY